MTRTLQNDATSDEVAYQKIKSAIVSGYFKAGERLRELELAEKLGISRTPVRQALQMLEREGFLGKSPYKGFMVRKYNLKEAENIFQIRSALEGLAAYLLAQTADDGLILELRRQLNLASDALAGQNLAKVAEINNEFHHLFATSCGNSMLADMLLNLRGCISILRVSTWTVSGRPAQTQQEHEVIMDAVERRQPEQARAAAVLHVENSWQVAGTVLRREVFEL